MAYHSTVIGKDVAVARNLKCHSMDHLAPEVLSMIFLQVIALHERPFIIISSPSDGFSKENEVVAKPSLTHVCRYWRQVALGNPALWRCIRGWCSEEMEAFLERSLPLTVSLFLDFVHWGPPEEESIPLPMESALKTHAMRLHRLDLLVIPGRQNIPFLLESLQAPYLEILTMTSPYLYFSFGLETITREHLFNSETSQLKALAIVPIANWIPACTSFPRLTHLFISADSHETGRCHPLDILELLSNAPVLEFLHVDSLLRDAPYHGDWRPPSDPVPLLLLRSLVFTSCSRKLIHAVISRLVLPGDVFIRLQDVVSGVNANIYYPSALPNIVLRPVTSLDVCTTDETILMVADGPTSGLWFEGYHDLGHMEPAIGWDAWLLDLHRCLTLSHVTSLHIFLHGHAAFFPALLDELPQVSRLAVLLGDPAPLILHPVDLATVAIGANGLPDVPQAVMPPSPLVILCRALSPSPSPSQPELAAAGGGVQAQARVRVRVRCPALSTLAIEWLAEPTRELMALRPPLPEMLAARARAGHLVARVIVQGAVALHSPLWSEVIPKPWAGVTGVPAPAAPEPEQDMRMPVPTTMFIGVNGDRQSLSFSALQFTGSPEGTRYEIVSRREDGGNAVCAFEMRDVWRVDGEDRYWEVDDAQKPCYVLP